VTEGKEVMERIRLLSVQGQPTKAVLAKTFMGVFFHSFSLIQILQRYFF
jgi:hypothetical protein